MVLGLFQTRRYDVFLLPWASENFMVPPPAPALEKAPNVSLYQLYFVKLLAMSKIRVGGKG